MASSRAVGGGTRQLQCAFFRYEIRAGQPRRATHAALEEATDGHPLGAILVVRGNGNGHRFVVFHADVPVDDIGGEVFHATRSSALARGAFRQRRISYSRASDIGRPKLLDPEMSRRLCSISSCSAV